MTTTAAFVEDLVARVGPEAGLTAKAMFGEYALYLDGKVVALVCDHQLFVKPTTAGRALLRHVDEAPPYPGATPHLRIVDEIDDGDALRRLLATTATALPAPKPKAVRPAKVASGAKAAKPRSR